MQTQQPRHYHLLAVLIVILSGLMVALYSVKTPMWEAPDEIGHFSYILELSSSKRLPMQETGNLGQAHQPPLYYAIAAILSYPAGQNNLTGALHLNPDFIWSGGDQINIGLHHTDETFPYSGQALAFHLARLASLLMGMVTVSLVIAIGWLIFPEQAWIGLLGAALVAFNPQFLFIQGSVNNDALLVMATTGIIWQTLRMQDRQNSLAQWLLLGLWIATAFLAKLSGFVVAAVAITYLSLISIKTRSYRRLLRGLLAAGLVVILLTGWWFVRNQILYGDPLGWSVFNDIFAAVFRTTPLAWVDVRQFFDVQFRSFWGVFGWMTVAAPGWFYSFILLLIIASLAGYVLAFISGRWLNLHRRQRTALALLVGALLAQEAYMLWAITRFDASWYQGRYLFPVIAPVAILLSFGLETLFSQLPGRSRTGARIILVFAMAGLTLYMAIGVIAPAYRTAALPKMSIWFLKNRLDVLFDDLISLRGYEIETDQEDSSITLRLYWQASQKPDLDYSAFVHLEDSSDRLLDQDDGAPGENQGYPPQLWLPGDIVEDWRILSIPPDAQPPFEIRVGLYNWLDGRRLPATSAEGPLGDAVSISLEEP
ncbi:MAG: glycosyltransferase family 39 protein [Candidatus Promineifilaceae bacterium]